MSLKLFKVIGYDSTRTALLNWPLLPRLFSISRHDVLKSVSKTFPWMSFGIAAGWAVENSECCYIRTLYASVSPTA